MGASALRVRWACKLLSKLDALLRVKGLLLIVTPGQQHKPGCPGKPMYMSLFFQGARVEFSCSLMSSEGEWPSGCSPDPSTDLQRIIVGSCLIPSFAQETVEESEMIWRQQIMDTIDWSLCPSTSPVHTISNPYVNPEDSWACPHAINEEWEAQRCQLTCLKPQSLPVLGLIHALGSWHSQTTE